MANEDNPLVQFKFEILKKAMPAKDAVVFGDIYVVEGLYTKKCIELGCEKALLIDAVETPNWLEIRKANPTINFYKGDFSNTLFMRSIKETCEIGVAFDILLHQPPLLNTIHLITEKIKKKICIVQPMLREQTYPNTLVYLPGNSAHAELYPLQSDSDQYKVFDVNAVNQSHWIWGMTPTFLSNVLKGEGFEIIYQEELANLPNKNWFWWGCVAARVRENPTHWSAHGTIWDLLTPNWYNE